MAPKSFSFFGASLFQKSGPHLFAKTSTRGFYIWQGGMVSFFGCVQRFFFFAVLSVCCSVGLVWPADVGGLTVFWDKFAHKRVSPPVRSGGHLARRLCPPPSSAQAEEHLRRQQAGHGDRGHRLRPGPHPLRPGCPEWGRGPLPPALLNRGFGPGEGHRPVTQFLPPPVFFCFTPLKVLMAEIH